MTKPPHYNGRANMNEPENSRPAKSTAAQEAPHGLCSSTHLLVPRTRPQEETLTPASAANCPGSKDFTPPAIIFSTTSSFTGAGTAKATLVSRTHLLHSILTDEAPGGAEV